ncbi:hypothetical protein AAFF_G00076980 [Aldrovandia affinis]|uniref:Lymphoid-restricted membrane protein n=1 Tax=Aldrovandia affinis TaxID=143900 RepID=A0AAD7RXR0_9TELE|nr:hypothetical protein AAFF_G00076980 [Aldrovandia affinis]
MDVGLIQRRHNPVDSICRKLQTIQRRAQEADSPFQIPRFQSRSYDSPQSGLRGNLEAILKRRAVRRDSESEGSQGMPTPTGSPRSCRSAHAASPSNATYTISGTLGERHNVGPRPERAWSRSCSTPATMTANGYFSFSQCGTSTRPESSATIKDRCGSPANGRHAYYNLNFCPSDTSALLDCDPGYSALVVKRLSMGDGAIDRLVHRNDTLEEVSLICEEDLLDTIFHACDTQRRGKVCVSHIVDYLRHTTSRGSEDSGLEELCHMLDPDQKDVSMDLDTYHAIMKEWIQDCRNQDDDTAEDLLQESVKRRDSQSAGRRIAVLNMTSGSLEAFGGEASRGDLETSDLVYCVADLQFNNQKLQDEVRKLKQATETMEDLNHKLIEENETLKTQAKIGQQLAQKEKLLKEEAEEMKAALSASVESRTKATAQIKHMERENHGLITKISSLQEENIKVSLEIDDLQRKMIELCDLNADLQVQIHSFDGILHEKESCLGEKSRQIEELKSMVEEYSCVAELLRAEKLESQMQMIQPDMAATGLSLSVAYRLNQTSSGSLQAELALAQGSERLPSSLCFTSPLDEALDREVLLLLQGPTPDQMSVHFKTLLSKLDQDFKEDCSRVLSTLKQLMETHSGPDPSANQKLQALQAELEQKRREWAHSLQQLDQYTGSLEKELIKMASNMRRSRTEILHMSVRAQEQENRKQQLQEKLEQLRAPPPQGREASAQTEEHQHQVAEESDGSSLGWEEDFVPPNNWKDKEEQPNFRREEEEQPNVEREEEEQLSSRREEEDRSILVCDGQELSETRGEGEDWRKTEEGVWDSSGEDVEEKLWGNLTQSGGPAPGESLKSEELAATDALERGLRVRGEPPQKVDSFPGCTGPQDSHHRAAPHVPDLSEPRLADAVNPDPLQAHPTSSEQDLAVSPGRPLSKRDLPTLLEHTAPRQGKVIPPVQRSCTQGEWERGGSPGDTVASNMTEAKDLSLDQLPASAVTLDSASVQSVPVEGQDMQEAGQVLPVEAHTAGVHGWEGGEDCSQPVGGSPQLTDGQATTAIDLSEEATEDAALNAGLADDCLSPLGSQSTRGPKRDSLTLRNKFKRELELSGSMEAIEEQKTQEELIQAVEKDDTPLNSEDTESDSTKEDRNSLSPSDKEVETEFHRLSLGFKCDMFTLEKRLRLEERSRDLAEDNLKREVSSCQELLQMLLPLCEDDNKSMEIIQRLQKNLDILNQSMARVSSRSEMLGAIHQESRVSRAVEVMIQHVENLRRMYTKEHTELVELRETLVQSERSFGSNPERDDFRNKKGSGSQYYKPSRRVSIPVILRNSGGAMHFDMPKPQETSDMETNRTGRRSSWNERMDTSSEDEKKKEVKGRRSSLTELGSKITSLLLTSKIPADQKPSRPKDTRPSVPRRSRGWWVSVVVAVLLAALLAMLASWALQPSVDAAPVGTGDSWKIIQQLLWPYTGLRHNGQPPV